MAPPFMTRGIGKGTGQIAVKKQTCAEMRAEHEQKRADYKRKFPGGEWYWVKGFRIKVKAVRYQRHTKWQAAQ